MRYNEFYTNYEPFSHQRTAIDHVWWHLNKHNCCYLRASMGAGKTKIVIDIVNNRDDIYNVLVLCPHKAIQVWEHEIHKHSINDKYPGTLPVRVLPLEQRTLDAKLKKLNAFIEEKCDTCINYIIINYESANKLGLHHIDWDLIVTDESHYLKTYDSIRTKYAAKLARKGKYRIAMTGTPIGGKYEHIFGQFQFLDERAYGSNYYAFKYYYCVMGGYNNKDIVGYVNIPHFNNIYRSRTVDIEVDHNIPSRHIDIPLTLEDVESKKIYKKYVDDLKKAIAEGDEMRMQACITRMRQVTSGYTVHAGQMVPLNTLKIDALEELLGGINENVVVFYWFREDMRRIKKLAQHMNYTLYQINGDHNDYRKVKTHSGLPMLIACQIQSASESIDLTDARYCIYYSSTHRFLDYTQSLSRLDRPGQDQTHGIIYYHLIVRKTVDESLRKSNDKKKDIMESLIGGEIGV